MVKMKWLQTLSIMKMNNTFVKIWVHNMEVDRMVDFLLGRIEDAPTYFICETYLPESITGGWIELSITFERYLRLRQVRIYTDLISLK
jgi:hypothetical protein